MTDKKTTKYEGVVAGVYEASINDWGIREADIGGNKQLLTYIVFDFEAAGKTHRIHWESFLLKKDGDVNQKTMNGLAACGFKGMDISNFMSDTALNTFKKVNITLELENGYWRVQWINNPDESPKGKADEVKSLAGYDLSKVNASLASKNADKQVKNHAPGAEVKSEFEKGLGF